MSHRVDEAAQGNQSALKKHAKLSRFGVTLSPDFYNISTIAIATNSDSQNNSFTNKFRQKRPLGALPTLGKPRNRRKRNFHLQVGASIEPAATGFPKQILRYGTSDS